MFRNVWTFNWYKTQRPYRRRSCEFCQYSIIGWHYIANDGEKQVFVKCEIPLNLFLLLKLPKCNILNVEYKR